MVSMNSWATSAPALGQRYPRKRKWLTAKSHAENASSRPRVKTAPQKDRTGAPVSSWNPYQPAATSSAAASRAVTTDTTVIPAGLAAGAGTGPPAFGPPGCGSAGSAGFTGGLDTLAPYRT